MCSLKLRIKALQTELADLKVKGVHEDSPQETLLADAYRLRDRYKADYLEAYRHGLRLQAEMEAIKPGTSSG